MFAGKKSAQIREILINESAWEEMTCLFAPSLNSGGNNSLMKHDVVQGNNIVDLDLLRNLNGVPGLNRDNFIYISNIFSNIKQRNEKIMQ